MRRALISNNFHKFGFTEKNGFSVYLVIVRISDLIKAVLRGPVLRRVWHDKDPSPLKSTEDRVFIKSTFSSPPSAMVTSHCGQNSLELE